MIGLATKEMTEKAKIPRYLPGNYFDKIGSGEAGGTKGGDSNMLSDYVIGVMREMSAAAEKANKENNHIAEQRKAAQKNLSDGIWGKKAYDDEISALDARKQAASKSLESEIDALVDKYRAERADRFSMKPTEMVEFSAMLNAVDLYRKEAFDMFQKLKLAGEVTKARAVCYRARTLGHDLADDTPRYLDAADNAVTSFAQYCRGMGGGTSYGQTLADNWGRILEVNVAPLLKAEDDWVKGTYACKKYARERHGGGAVEGTGE